MPRLRWPRCRRPQRQRHRCSVTGRRGGWFPKRPCCGHAWVQQRAPAAHRLQGSCIWLQRPAGWLCFCSHLRAGRAGRLHHLPACMALPLQSSRCQSCQMRCPGPRPEAPRPLLACPRCAGRPPLRAAAGRKGPGSHAGSPPVCPASAGQAVQCRTMLSGQSRMEEGGTEQNRMEQNRTGQFTLCSTEMPIAGGIARAQQASSAGALGEATANGSRAACQSIAGLVRRLSTCPKQLRQLARANKQASKHPATLAGAAQGLVGYAPASKGSTGRCKHPPGQEESTRTDRQQGKGSYLHRLAEDEHAVAVGQQARQHLLQHRQLARGRHHQAPALLRYRRVFWLLILLGVRKGAAA